MCHHGSFYFVMTNMATCLYSEVSWGEGRAGGDDLNMKPVGRTKETVDT